MPEDYKDEIIKATMEYSEKGLKAVVSIMDSMVNSWKKEMNGDAARSKKEEPLHGKMSLKELNAQGRGLENIDVDKSDLYILKRELNKLQVDFSAKREKGTNLLHVFFKGQDANRVYMALEKCVNAEKIKSALERQPMKEKLKEAEAKANDRNRERVTTKELQQKKTR